MTLTIPVWVVFIVGVMVGIAASFIGAMVYSLASLGRTRKKGGAKDGQDSQ